MSTFRNTTALGLCAMAMFCMDMTGAGIRIVSDAEAIVGRPATPVSYAGVARRTTYRAAETVAVTSAAASASAPPPQATTLAVGTAVAALPGGCVPATIGGVAYQKCGNVYYQAAYQGNNLVYIVSAP